MATATTSTAFFDNPHLLTAIGIGLSLGLSALGSAIGSAHGAIYAVRAPSFQVLAFVPIVTAGVLAIYGLIIGYLLTVHHANDPDLSIVDGTKNLAAGAAVGLSSLASGLGMAVFIGKLNDGSATTSPKATPATPAAAGGTQENEPLLSAPTNEEVGAYSKTSYRKIIFANMFIEAIGLYGLIVALMLTYKPN